MSSQLLAKIIAAGSILAPHGINVAIGLDGTIGLFIGQQLVVDDIQPSEEYLSLTDEQLAGLFNLFLQKTLQDAEMQINSQSDITSDYLLKNIQPCILSDEHTQYLNDNGILYTRPVPGICVFLFADTQDDIHVVLNEDVEKTHKTFQELLNLAMDHARAHIRIKDFAPIITSSGKEKTTYMIQSDDESVPCSSALLCDSNVMSTLTEKLGDRYYVLITEIDELLCLPIDVALNEIKDTQTIVQIMRKSLDLANIGTDFCGTLYEYDNGIIKLVNRGDLNA